MIEPPWSISVAWSQSPPAMILTTCAVDLSCVVKPRNRVVDNLLSASRGRSEQRPCRGTGNLPCFHLRPEPIPVEGELCSAAIASNSSGGNVGLVHLTRFGPGDDAPSCRLHLVEDPLDFAPALRRSSPGNSPLQTDDWATRWSCRQLGNSSDRQRWESAGRGMARGLPSVAVEGRRGGAVV